MAILTVLLSLFLLFLLFGLPIIIVVKIIVKNTKKEPKQINIMEENYMKYCSNCGAEIRKNAVVCLKCGCATNQFNRKSNNSLDQQSVGLNILSFFAPLIGFILYIAFNDEKPIKAKGCGKWALISFITNFALTILFFLIIIASSLF